MIEITLELEDGEWAATVKSSVPSSITAYSETKLGGFAKFGRACGSQKMRVYSG